MEFLEYYEFLDNKINFERSEFTVRVAAKIADMTDNAIINSIISFAEQEGITDLYLLDEEFVKIALLKEIERRKGR